jgi:hypothetical protein
MGRGARGAAVVMALAAAACVRVPQPPPGSLDSPRFNQRGGWPDYATTIRYIADHVRYEDFDSGFAIGPTGDMCYVYEPGYAWCVPPKEVAYIGIDNYIEVHCSKWYPQCIYKTNNGIPTREIANEVQVRERFEDRAKVVAAFNHLIYLMGGPDPTPDPFAAKATAPGG